MIMQAIRSYLARTGFSWQTAAMLSLCLGLGACNSSQENTRLYRYPQPGQAGDEVKARDLNRQGIAAYRAGDLELAEQLFESSLNADMTFGPAHNSMGRLQFERGDHYRAAVAFENATRLMPGSAEPVNNLGLVYEAVGRLNDATDLYDRAIAIAPNNTELLGNRLRAEIRADGLQSHHREELEDLVLKAPDASWRQWAGEQLSRIQGRPLDPALFDTSTPSGERP